MGKGNRQSQEIAGSKQRKVVKRHRILCKFGKVRPVAIVGGPKEVGAEVAEYSFVLCCVHRNAVCVFVSACMHA